MSLRWLLPGSVKVYPTKEGVEIEPELKVLLVGI
jgi:hypothetical protein